MKKNCLRFLAVGVAVVVCGQFVSARQLSANEALTRALKSEQSSPAGLRKARSIANQTTVHTISTHNNEAAAFYVFEGSAGDGFIVASADDRLQPVLGVADSGSFSEVPENMKWWISQYQDEISAYYEANGTDGDATEYKSVYDLYDSWAPIEPICKTQWGQTDPYNLLCPMLNGSRTVTGCVATALAQAIKAIRYFKGSGSNSYTTGAGAAVSFDFSAYQPDWSKMRDKYDSSATKAEKDEVAKLMYACGVAVNMNYNTQSGAVYNTDNIKKYLGFDNETFTANRSGMTSQDWETLIYELLKAGKPVCYGGSGSGGHAFICDGYSEDGFFHFNWGWSGMGDGYFRLSSLNPRAIGTGGFAGGYTMGQYILVLMTPDDEKLELSTYRPGTVVVDYDRGLNFQGKSGTKYTFGLTYMLSTYNPLEIGMGLLIEPRDGSGQETYIAPNGYYLMQRYKPSSSFVVKIPEGTLKEGCEYDAYPVYSCKGYNGYWKVGSYQDKSTVYDHYLLKFDEKGDLVVYPEKVSTKKLLVSGMEVNDFYVNDSANNFKAMLTNFSTRDDFSGALDLRIYKDDKDLGSVLNEVSYLLLGAGETTTYDISLPMKNFEAGKYELRIIYNGDILTSDAKIPVEIKSGKRPEPDKVAAPAGNFEVSFWVDGARQPMAPVSIVAGAEFSGVTAVIAAESVSANYSLAFFKHGETYPALTKFQIYNAAIKGTNTWQQGTAFTVKPDLAIGAYTMAFVDPYGMLVSYPADFLVGTEKDGIVYSFDADANALVVSGANGAVPTKIEIPAEVEGFSVVGVAPGAFDRCSKVEEISLPATVKQIGLNAFRGASSLRHVTFGGKDVPFANSAIAFASVNPTAEFYVDGAAYADYKNAFQYRGKLFASITSLKLPAETAASVGTSIQVPVEVAPAENYNPEFTAEVADSKILGAEIVDGKVKITAKAEGETTVTVTSAQPGVTPVSMKVKVEPAPSVPVEISLSQTSLDMTEGETAELKAELKNAPEGAIAVWESSDDKVAEVDANGKVTAIGGGEAVITVSYGDATKTCTVKVTPKAPAYAISLNKDAVTLDEGATFQLWYNFSGDVPKDVKVVYSSGDTSVATVSENGLITAVKAGETVITATCGEVKATCAVTVKGTVTPPPAPEYDLKLSETSVELTEGETKVIGYEFTGEAPKDAEVVWSTSDETVATVNNGVVTAVKAGEAVITATCGDKSATCAVKVNAKPVPPTPEYDLKLSDASIELKEGESKVIGYEFTGEAPKDAEVVWTSGNETVATVENGVVTAVKAGEAVITATCGEKSATCTVVVIKNGTGTGDDEPDDAIAEVEADANARYFDLSGRRIASPRGVCIELKNGVARKVMVK